VSDKHTYVGLFPWMGQWWLDNIKNPPLIVIRCGRGEPWCTNAIGEVKTDGTRVLAMSRNEYPEIETDWTPLAAPTVEELAAELAERDAQVLRYVGDGPGGGKIVYRRTALPREVAPPEDLTFYVCRVHGEVEVDRAALAAAVRDTLAARKVKCPFWARHGVA